jgi:peptidyl-prolyl cis-trans isomerase C
MKLKIITLLLISAISSFSMAEEQPAAAATASQPEAAATAGSAAPTPQMLVAVNGQPVTDADVLAFNALQGNKMPLNTEQGQMQVMNQLINTALVAQAATTSNLQDNPQVAAAIRMATMQVLAEVQINNYLASQPVTDEEIKTAYDEKFGPDKLTEYKARHILVKDEQEAKDLIKTLDEGKDFAELAKEKSLDPSKSNGGDLGWIGRGQVVASFGDAMAQQEKGKHSTTPVQTQFGWHIILVEDSRPQVPPKMEDVKQQFQTLIQQQRLSAYIEGLRKTAKIEVAGLPEAAATAPAEAVK